MSEPIRKKILIIGAPNVGKESLCRAYYPDCSEYFGKEYTPCIPETIQITRDATKIELELWVVTFDVYYKNLRQLCYPDTDSPESLYELEENIVPEVLYKCPNKPVILVGNKKDLRKENPEICLKTMNGENMAKKIGAVAYIENSSLTKEGVSYVFEWATQAAFIQSRKKSNQTCSIS